MSQGRRHREVRDTWWLVEVAGDRAEGFGAHVPPEPIPEEAVRRGLGPGGLAALVFARETAFDDELGKYERLWVEVSEVDGEGGYVGNLDNQPTFIRGLTHGAEVRFHAGHVFGVMRAPSWSRRG